CRHSSRLGSLNGLAQSPRFKSMNAVVGKKVKRVADCGQRTRKRSHFLSANRNDSRACGCPIRLPKLRTMNTVIRHEVEQPGKCREVCSRRSRGPSSYIGNYPGSGRRAIAPPQFPPRYAIIGKEE